MTSHSKMEPAGPSERKFWEETFGLANPGWVANVSADHVGAGLTSQDVVIYVVDTASGLVFAAGFPERDVIKVVTAAHAAEAEKAMVSFAIQTIRRLGIDNVQDPKCPEAREAILSVIAALASTTLFRVVQARTGGLKGHWIYMVYQPRAGDPIARSTYAQRDAPGVFPLGDLYETCAAIIAGDMKNPGVVNSLISKSGGLDLCTHLRGLVSGE